MKRFIRTIALLLLGSGCAAVGMIDRTTRLEPQFEQLAVLQDATNQDGKARMWGVSVKNQNEAETASAVARLMGWNVMKYDGKGMVLMDYSKKK